MQYVGRFAPSPTGALHFGSLVAALGSWLDARAAGGRWLLRIEDVDSPRTVAGADHTILHQLEAYGLSWDGEPLWQSRRVPVYAAALAQLRAAGQVYPCACSRRELADSALAPDGARRYPGICRDGLAPGRVPRAWRLRTEPGEVVFMDRLLGEQREDVWAEVGDFVLLRADGQYAYQLAVVVDDAEQGVSDVVRGADLLGSSARQIVLQRALGLPTPRYLHLPVATNDAGEKLSKQTLARALDPARPQAALVGALRFLGQQPEPALVSASVADILAWALAHWQVAAIPALRACGADQCLPP